MPVLTTDRKKIEVTLPKTGGKVVLWDELLAGDFRKVLSSGGLNDSKTFELLLTLITEWDFTDEQGNVLPVTQENLDKLPALDLNTLAEQVTKVVETSTVSEDLKKNTNKSST